jgi:hypothetical protein
VLKPAYSPADASLPNEDTDNEAQVYWASGYGRHKYLGLHQNPLAQSKPSDYSLAPLDIMLPELSLEQKDKLTALSYRVLDLTTIGSIRTDPCTLLRYLRARKGNVEQAEILLREAAKFRQKHDINRVFTHWNLEAYEQCLAPWWLSGGWAGHGRNGEPIAFERLGRCNFSKLTDQLPFEDLLKLDILHSCRSLAAVEDDAIRRGMPLIPVIVVMDLQGFGPDQIKFGAMRKLAQLVESRSLLLTEVTGKIIAVNAPPAAAKAWALLKHLLDPGTAAKVEVVAKADTHRVLLEHMEEHVIPAYLGGTMHVEGDPECRKVLAPGGLPPPDALSRFRALLDASDQENDVPMWKRRDARKVPRWRFCCG